MTFSVNAEGLPSLGSNGSHSSLINLHAFTQITKKNTKITYIHPYLKKNYMHSPILQKQTKITYSPIKKKLHTFTHITKKKKKMPPKCPVFLFSYKIK